MFWILTKIPIGPPSVIATAHGDRRSDFGYGRILGPAFAFVISIFGILFSANHPQILGEARAETQARIAQATSDMKGPIEYLVVSGRVNLDTTETEIRRVDTFRSHLRPPRPLPGRYLLRLEDRNGSVIEEIFFRPLQAIIDDFEKPETRLSRRGYFEIYVPDASRIHRVSVLLASVELASVERSPNAPAVQVLFPNGSEALSGDTVTVTWNASDTDGDPLTSIVRFSADGGRTWETMAYDPSGQNVDLELDRFKGTERGLIQVVVTDGFNKADDASNGVFSVPNKPPEVAIEKDYQRKLFEALQPVIFDADARDLEDGRLDDQGVEWSSNIDGVIATGDQLYMPSSQLSEGVHILTATATDSAGEMASDRVTIRITHDRLTRGDVLIDVIPGDEFNTFDLGEVDMLPVAILAEDEFTVSDVDPLSVAFGPDATLAVKDRLLDVDGDGDEDLLLDFDFVQSGIQCGDVMVRLTGKTFDGLAIQGVDALTTIGCDTLDRDRNRGLDGLPLDPANNPTIRLTHEALDYDDIGEVRSVSFDLVALNLSQRPIFNVVAKAMRFGETPGSLIEHPKVVPSQLEFGDLERRQRSTFEAVHLWFNLQSEEPSLVWRVEFLDEDGNRNVEIVE